MLLSILCAFLVSGQRSSKSTTSKILLPGFIIAGYGIMPDVAAKRSADVKVVESEVAVIHESSEHSVLEGAWKMSYHSIRPLIYQGLNKEIRRWLKVGERNAGVDDAKKILGDARCLTEGMLRGIGEHGESPEPTTVGRSSMDLPFWSQRYTVSGCQPVDIATLI